MDSLKSAYITFSSISLAKTFFKCLRGELTVNCKNYKLEYSSVGETNIEESGDTLNAQSSEESKDYHEDWQCEAVKKYNYILLFLLN